MNANILGPGDSSFKHKPNIAPRFFIVIIKTWKAGKKGIFCLSVKADSPWWERSSRRSGRQWRHGDTQEVKVEKWVPQ